ncbi:hypothetical protein [Streptomyces spiramyceticus]|uniref:hypothetical protein n=1 Tax=Streptomyces spiramyceticus TaxID=299717 RepID=UPI00237C1784|nr:hypothetical protein [Streptomyces spiramyceticus]
MAGIPLWLLKQILNPRFPDSEPQPRLPMTEDTYLKIKADYLRGLTATESWRSLLDEHNAWFTLTTITKLYISFAQDADTLRPEL